MLSHAIALERAHKIVAKMTLEEKASQLKYDAPAIPRLGIPAYNWWNEALHGVARAGTATVFPQAIALAASFDERAQKEIAEVIATEGRAKYNAQSRHGDRDIYKGLTFWSPNVNIFRDPRWGRGQETYGEDPYLTSRMGVAFVKGLQGDGEHLKAAACAKHFAVHSGPEEGRHAFDAQVSEKDLRETYLAAFEALVKEADVESVMGAYNRINGEPACGSQHLLVDILRGEWAFEGHVVSDCWAIADIHNHHHVTDTAPESAALAISKGCDLNCGNTYLHLMTAYQEGRVTEEQITQAACRVIATRIRLGVLDGESEYDDIPATACDTDAHDALAYNAAVSGMVLLKNDGVLPLDIAKIQNIAVIGPNADSVPALEGNYCGTSSRYVTCLEGIRRACEGKARVWYSQGCHLFKDRTSGLAAADDRLAEAVFMAEASDVSVLCLGLDAGIEGEEGDTGNSFSAGDKRDLELPECQRKLLAAVIAVGKPVIVVLMAGSALAVRDGNAILQAWYPGQAGGRALADVLFGKAAPGGRLPVTFYNSVSDLPPFTEYAMTNRTYRYFEGEALYPFGFGLGYTNFSYSFLRREGDALCVTVKNTGDRPGDAVTQVYVKDLDSPYAARNHSLCAFERTHLASGESRVIRLKIPESAFTSVDERGMRARYGKHFRFYVGGSQPDEVSVRLTGQRPLEITVEA